MEILKAIGTGLLVIGAIILYFCFYAVMLAIAIWVGFIILSWIF